MEDGIEAVKLPEKPLATTERNVEDNVPGSMPEAGHAHAPHGHGSGVPWLDIIVTVSVVFISVLSLVVSIEHGRTMEKMVDQNQKLVVASTLPLLNVDSSMLDPVTYKPKSRLVLGNNGVGPAIIERFEIRYKGVSQTPKTILDACCAQTLGKSGDRSGFVYSNVSGTILPAREKIDLITIMPIGADDKLLRAFEEAWNKDISVHVCYCSVLEECWEADFDDNSLPQRPQPVKECKVSPGDKLW